MIKSMIKPQKSRVAVFVDAANFEISLKQCDLYADYSKLMRMIEQYGKPVILRYYSVVFKTKGQDRFFSFIKNRGFKIVTKDVKIIKSGKGSKNKANFDVEIAFDSAVRIGEFDTLILFSGDSDFVYLIYQLQKRTIKTIVISPSFRTAKELRQQADNFIDLRDCDFAKKKPLFRGAHNSLSTAKRFYQKK